MFYKNFPDGYLVRLTRGEEIRAGLAELMERESIGCGFVTGLGAITHPHVGYYVLEEKRYVERHFEEEYELAGMTGTLSWYEGKPFSHVHVMLTGRDFQSIGGHCFAATTTATVEMYVRAEKDRVDREYDDAIGLHLMELPTSCPIGPHDL